MTYNSATRLVGGSDDRRAGSLLVELVVGLTILTVGILSYFFVFFANFRGAQQMEELDEARVALENIAESMKGVPFQEAYSRFHGQSVEVPGLRGPEGGAALVRIECCVNELDMPSEFGPIQDLNGDGVLESIDCSGDYKLLPTRLVLPFQTTDGTSERCDLYLVLGEDL